MRIKASHILYCINVLTILLILIIVFLPDNVLRVIIGLPFVLLFPGFTFISALYPRKSSLDRIERLVLSLGLSVAIVPILMLILNFTPWGIHLNSVLITLTIFVVLSSGFALFGQWRLPEQERPVTVLHMPAFPKRSTSEKVLSLILVLAVLGSIGFAVYTVTKPKIQDKYSEFYILGEDNMVESYPTVIRLGSSGSVTMGIINHEQVETTYRVEIITAGSLDNIIESIVLQPEAKYESTVSFKPGKTGSNQQVKFLLYRDNQTDVYLELHLWVDVE